MGDRERGGHDAGGAPDLSHLALPTDLDDHAGTDPVSIASCSPEANLQPVARRAVVAQQVRRVVQRGQQQVQVAVAVDVQRERRPAGLDQLHARPRAILDRIECPVRVVAEQCVLLAMAGAEVLLVHLRVDVAVRDEQVFPAVVVEVNEHDAPAQREVGRRTDAGNVRDVREHPVTIVAVQRVVIVGEVADREVDQTVAVEVADADAHAGLLVSLLVVGHAGQDRRIDEAAVALVHEVGVLERVIGHVQVVVPIAIGIEETYAQPEVGFACLEPGLPRVLRERGNPVSVRVAVVAIEHVGLGDQVAWAAVNLDAAPHARRSSVGQRLGAGGVALEGEFDVVRDVEVEVAVVIHVAPARGHPPVIVVHTRLRTDVGEGPVAVVAVQPVGPPVGEVDVGVAVVVVVADGRAEAPAGVSQSRGFGDVGERRDPVAVRVTVVSEQDVGRTVVRVRRTRTLREEKVGIPVAVVVQPRSTDAQRADDVVDGFTPTHQQDVAKSGLLADVDQVESGQGSLRLRCTVRTGGRVVPGASDQEEHEQEEDGGAHAHSSTGSGMGTARIACII